MLCPECGAITTEPCKRSDRPLRENSTEIIGQVWDGLITVDQACRTLDERQIRGTFDDEGFLGYDYATQRWLKILYQSH